MGFRLGWPVRIASGTARAGHRVTPDICGFRYRRQDVPAAEEASPLDLMNELNRKRWAIPLWPLSALGAAAAVIATLHLRCPPWATLSLAAAGVLWVVHRYRCYVALRSTVVHYELSDGARRTYGVLTRLGRQIARCGVVQHVNTRRLAEESGEVYNGGGNALLPSCAAELGFKAPAGLKSNVVPLRLKGKKLALYFYPDHVLVQSPKGFETVPYHRLKVEIGFVECATTRPPPDATLVGQTWRHVDPRGLPDRRYKDNYKVPVYKFVRARFRSWSGLDGFELDEIFDFSRESVAPQLSGFLEGIAGVAWAG